jgi:hypothetical protein
MNLKSYLKNNKITYKKFGSLIGVSCLSVFRYTKGDRKPNDIIMQLIFKATKGDVTPNDFYQLPKIKIRNKSLQDHNKTI